MKIFISPYSNRIIDKPEGECLLFIQSKWDDYGFKTTYSVYYYDVNGERNTNFGEVKIISIDSTGYDENGFLTLSGEFKKIPDNCASLGQSDEFYSRFLNKFDDKAEDILAL
ncbi:hypothetical protein [Erwinia tasmaniensis]|uniref:hypothetical protein n=1 Tax=Erwinia tasmaniensis TaxID=338565 RepID=UPI0005B444E8|nr:hypothetical protein [Erwinia tasmaniensis]